MLFTKIALTTVIVGVLSLNPHANTNLTEVTLVSPTISVSGSAGILADDSMEVVY
jgi:hypothetical protein